MKKSLKELKTAYAKAKKENKETFQFAGSTLFLSYAKYLIEYLEGVYKRGGIPETHKTEFGTESTWEECVVCGKEYEDLEEGLITFCPECGNMKKKRTRRQ